MQFLRLATFTACGLAFVAVGCSETKESSFKSVNISQEELEAAKAERFQKDFDGTVEFINKDKNLSAEQKQKLIDDAKMAIESRKQGQGTGQ